MPIFFIPFLFRLFMVSGFYFCPYSSSTSLFSVCLLMCSIWSWDIYFLLDYDFYDGFPLKGHFVGLIVLQSVTKSRHYLLMLHQLKYIGFLGNSFVSCRHLLALCDSLIWLILDVQHSLALKCCLSLIMWLGNNAVVWTLSTTPLLCIVTAKEILLHLKHQISCQLFTLSNWIYNSWSAKPC